MSAVVGVTVVAVDGEFAASTARDSEFRVTIGGRIGGVLSGGGPILELSEGLFLEGDRPLFVRAALVGGVWRSEKPVNGPKEPDSRLEKLFLLL